MADQELEPPITRTEALNRIHAAKAELDRATKDATDNHDGAETDWYQRANQRVNAEIAATKKVFPGLGFLTS